MILSRCPDCGTVFRVKPEEIALRQGMVRCGRCGHAFHALENLVSPPAPGAPAATQPEPQAGGAAIPAAPPPAPRGDAARESAPAPLPAPQPVAPLPAVTIEFPPLLDSGGPAQGPSPGPPGAEVKPGEALAGQGDGPPPGMPDSPAVTPGGTGEAPARSALSAGEALAESGREEIADAEASARRGSVAAQRHRAAASGVAVVLLAVLALFQLAYLLRQDIARAFPGARPQLQALCETLGCELDLPRHAELITIETSDLQPQAARKERLVLGATIRNRARFAQQIPHLELTLTDARDRALARRVFAPRDYLPPGSELKAGLAADAELAVHLVIDATGVGATGYRLYVFYP